MEQHFVHIPSPLLFAREARLSRAKYVNRAKLSTEKEDRQWNFGMAMMYKRHEKDWAEIYRQDYLM